MAVGAVTGDDTRSENPRLIEQVIRQRVAERAEQWFPDHGAAPSVHLRALSSRPRCLLYVVRVGDASRAPQILAKVRRGGPAGASDERSPGRPRLRTDSATAAELTALEYGGLRTIYATFGASHPTFGVVRPLDHLAAESTILMDYVDASTLRQAFIAESRLMLPSKFARRRVASGGAWHHAGAWLRAFHQSAPLESLPARQSTRQDVIDQFHAYHDFLTARLGVRSVGEIATSGAALAASVLPERLPLAVGHGDYAPRNMFVDARGRLIVFDPMPRWRAPCYEDLCRFLIGLRLLGLQLHSHGAAYSQHDVERRERDVISGYYGDEDAPLEQIRCYQLLIMLDKWSALVDAPGGGWRARLRATSLELANGYLQRQAHRLLELAHAAGS